MTKIISIIGIISLACYVWALVLEIKECKAKNSFD
jgi:hypothetical protein